MQRELCSPATPPEHALAPSLGLNIGQLDHFLQPHRFAPDERAEFFRRPGYRFRATLEQYEIHPGSSQLVGVSKAHPNDQTPVGHRYA